MRRYEDGYATIAATALMSSLSLVAIGYTNLSLIKSRQVDAAAQSILNEIALESWLLTHVTELAERREPVAETGVWHQARSPSLNVEYLISDEYNKLNLRSGDIDDISNVVRKVLPQAQARAALDAVKKLQSGRAEEVQSFKDVFENSLSSAQHQCLTDELTLLYAQRSLSEGEGESYIRDGSIGRIQARTMDTTVPRSLSIVVLFTGDQSDPFWILDWQSVPTSNVAECRDHAGT
ncbi:MAG: hypothetical protein AAF292_14200 [Pseudomonadota bacterium]